MNELYEISTEMKRKEPLLSWLVKLDLHETAAIISAQSSLKITRFMYFIEAYWTYPDHKTWDVFYAKWYEQ